MNNKLLKYLLNTDPEKVISKHGISLRKAIYPLIRKLSGPLTGVKGILLHSPYLPKVPKIFAVTHTYSYEDIAWGISYAGEQSFLLTNAVNELLHTSDGWALWASGVIMIDRFSKESRQASIEKEKKLLS